MKPDRVCTIVMACAVLHNIAQESQEPIPEEDEVDLVKLDQEDGEEHFAGVERDGVTGRDYMAQTYFT